MGEEKEGEAFLPLSLRPRTLLMECLILRPYWNVMSKVVSVYKLKKKISGHTGSSPLLVL